MSNEVLRSDNHDLFNHVRLRLIARNPIIPLEDIADEFGVEVNELCAWFLSYRLPPIARILPPADREPRDPELRAELRRLRHREGSLVTVVTEAPRQLVTVQRRIESLERAR